MSGALKVDRAVPCSMLILRGFAAIILASLAERAIHL
jgi:hypothetical protein